MLFKNLRCLLLQIRNAGDPMRAQEVHCFSRALQCPPERIDVFDLLGGVPTRTQLDTVDVVLLGGSGNHSVAEGGTWLPAALEAMRELHAWSKPTFASCWGFQAVARALGGKVVTDMQRAELGTLPLQLTDAGRADPVFRHLPSPFLAPIGHQDIVDRLPDDAVLLASSNRVTNQAFRLRDKPIYCTQFHPELDRTALLERVAAYPEYVQHIANQTLDEFAADCVEHFDTDSLLLRFAQHIFG